MPAQTLARFVPLPPRVVALEGHLREGRARLDGGYSLAWSLDALPLLLLRVGGTLRLAGTDTLLTATASMRPGGVALRDVSGRIGPGLAAQLARGSCTVRGIVDVAHLSLDRRRATANGTIDVAGGPCTVAGRTLDVPDTEVVLTGSGAAILATATAASGALLADARVTPDRRLSLRIAPAGAKLAGLSASAPIEVDIPF